MLHTHFFQSHSSVHYTEPEPDTTVYTQEVEPEVEQEIEEEQEVEEQVEEEVDEEESDREEEQKKEEEVITFCIFSVIECTARHILENFG